MHMTDYSLLDVISASLQTLLSETLFRADARGGYILNRGEPGFVETLKTLSAEAASTPPGPGRKPAVSHANHVLYGLTLMNRAVSGDAHAFEGADWNAAWQLERVTAAEWSQLLGELEAAARQLVETAPKHREWNQVMLTGVFAGAAHTAYHLGALRQILKDIGHAAS